MADKGWLSAWNLYWTSGSTFLYTQLSLEQRLFQDSLQTALSFRIQLEDSHSIFWFIVKIILDTKKASRDTAVPWEDYQMAV